MLSIQSPGADVCKGGEEVGPMLTKADKGERGQFWQIFFGSPLWITPFRFMREMEIRWTERRQNKVFFRKDRVKFELTCYKCALYAG